MRQKCLKGGCVMLKMKLAKKLLATASVITLAAILASPRAEAASLMDPVAVPQQDWNENYIGLHVGYGWADVDGFICDESCPNGTQAVRLGSSEGAFVGGHIGFTRQNGNMVWGLEVDLDAMTIDENTFDSTPTTNTKEISLELDTLASIRGRLGIANDDLLFYATGGVAYVGGSVTVNDSDEGVQFDIEEWHPVVGAGIAKHVTPHLTIGVEGLYYFVDWKRSGFSAAMPSSGDASHFVELDNILSLRVRASFRF